jgi:RNA polymerase sigma-70 factor (ECF subfamily)
MTAAETAGAIKKKDLSFIWASPVPASARDTRGRVRLHPVSTAGCQDRIQPPRAGFSDTFEGNLPAAPVRSTVLTALTVPDSLRQDTAETDRQILAAVAGGSADALERLYDRYAATAFGLARRILAQQDLAEEVVQDVFSQVWREAGRYDAARASVAGWIVLLTRTRAIDRLRARRARPDQDRPVEPVAQPLATAERSPEQVAISSEDARKVRAALAVLPDEQRSLVDLAYYEGLTHSEIAARTGVPLGTVKTRLRSAMMAMRAAIP